MKKNLPITGREVNLRDEQVIISTTDLKGIITYVNNDFMEISGFVEEELIGKNHNVIRHPEMPPAAFRDLWDTVKSGNSWVGMVKNRCKNGDHYWVEAYVTPVSDDCVGVAILTSSQGKFDDHLAEFPALATRLAGAPACSADRAAGPLRQRVRSRTAGRVMLVGDAAGYVDALTGEGLGIAFGGAELLIQNILAGTPQDYDRQWRQMSRRYRLMTAGLLAASELAPIRSMIVPAAAAFPVAFRGIVNLLAT